jgi:hypothetical protein
MCRLGSPVEVSICTPAFVADHAMPYQFLLKDSCLISESKFIRLKRNSS